MKFKCKDIVRLKIENISPSQSLFSSPFDAYIGLLVDAIIYPDKYKKTDMYQYQKYYELKKTKLEEIYEFFNSIRAEKSESYRN